MAFMELSAQSVEQQRGKAAERARETLTAGLREWSDERSRLTSIELGANPLRRVPRGWPGVTAASLDRLASEACLLDDEGARAEASRLSWSATAKLFGAAVSLAVPIALLVAMVSGA